MRRAAIALLPLALLAVGCSDDDGGTTTADAVGITTTDSTCVVAKTDLSAGKTTFKVTNNGSKVTEVYVYAPGDKVVTEKEDIGPGTSVNFTATLAGGTYEIACKPGQTGSGIRQTITVAGGVAASESGEAKYDREIEFEATEFRFSLTGFTGKPNEKIEFKMENKGALEHEFEVFGPDGTVLGEIGPTAAGKEGEAIITLAGAGTYTYVCDIDDHKTRGMTGSFTVA